MEAKETFKNIIGSLCCAFLSFQMQRIILEIVANSQKLAAYSLLLFLVTLYLPKLRII